MGAIISTHPNVFSHPDIIELYQEFSKEEANIIYEAMDKEDYSKLSECRYLDLDFLKRTAHEYKELNPEAVMIGIALYKTKRGPVPQNTYAFYWDYLGKTIVVNTDR